MNGIDQIIKELIRILLSVSSELPGNFSNGLFHIIRGDPGFPVNPHILHQSSISLSHSPLRTHDVIRIDFPSIQIKDHILGEGLTVTQALKSGVHETGVSQVGKTDPPNIGFLVERLANVNLGKFKGLWFQ